MLACNGGIDGFVGCASVDGIEVIRVWIVFFGGGGRVGVRASAGEGGDIGSLILGVLRQQRDRVHRL